MESSRDYEVLLLSASPDVHAAHMNALRRRGATVRVAAEPSQALQQLRQPPSLVFVDLVYGPCLNTEVVRLLNRARRDTMVVALHEGRLDAFGELVEDLSVDGFCRLGDWHPVAARAVPSHAGCPANVH